MTENEILDIFDKIDFIAFTKPRLVAQLASEPILINWIEGETISGKSKDDEYYAYNATGLDKSIGTCLSYLKYVDPNGAHIEIPGEFPTIADAVMVNDKKYWIITMVGQGAVSWLCTDAVFREEYGSRI